MRRFSTALFVLSVLSFQVASAADTIVNPPRKAPEFAISMADGGTKLLSSYRGKVVCLAFMYTTCPHCQNETKLLTALNSEYGPRGFQPLGVVFDPMSNITVRDFIRNFRPNFPIGYSTREQVHNYLGYPLEAPSSVPQIVFIDRKGMIRQQSKQNYDNETATEQNLRKMIETLLGESAGVSGKKSTSGKKKAS